VTISSSSKRKHLPTPALCAAILIFFALNVSLYLDFTEDDAGVSFRYARHLVEGEGLTYNPGERVEGYSNFGYVVLLSLVYKLVGMFTCRPEVYLVLLVKVLNLAVSSISILLCYLLSARLFGRSRLLSCLTALLLASNGAFAINTASPLETSTYTMLLVLLIYLLTKRETSQGSTTSWQYDSCCVAVACLFSVWRIDAPLLLAAVFIGHALALRFALTKRHFVMLGAWLLLYTTYTLGRYAYFGEWLNNPYHTKIGASLAAGLSSGYTNDFFFLLGANAYIYLALFVTAAAMDFRDSILPLVLIIWQWLYIALVGGDWMTGFRFWAPLTPMICILIASLVKHAARKLPRSWPQLSTAIALLALAAWWAASGTTMYQLDARSAGRVWRDPSALSPSQINPYWKTAEWLNSNVKQDSVITVSEAGYIPFLTDLISIDTYGLCNYELARIEGTRGRLGLKVHWGDDRDPAYRYIQGRKPDLIVMGPTREPAPPALGDYDYLISPEDRMHIYLRRGSQALQDSALQAPGSDHAPSGSAPPPESS